GGQPDRRHRPDPAGRGGHAGDRQGRRLSGARCRARPGAGRRGMGQPPRRRRGRVEQGLGATVTTDAVTRDVVSAAALTDMTSMPAAIVMPYTLTAGKAVGTFLAELA